MSVISYVSLYHTSTYVFKCDPTKYREKANRTTYRSYKYIWNSYNKKRRVPINWTVENIVTASLLRDFIAVILSWYLQNTTRYQQFPIQNCTPVAPFIDMV